MKYARVQVRDKEGIYDAVSEGLKTDILDLGIKGVKDIEYIQVYTFRGRFSKRDISRIAEEILSDKISQEYTYKKGGFLARKNGDSPHLSRPDHPSDGAPAPTGIEIAYNPGVMDPVEESTLKAVRDMGIKGVTSVSTSKKYVIKGALSKKEIERIREELLYNKIIQHVVERNQGTGHFFYNKCSQKKVICPMIYCDIINVKDSELKNLSQEAQLYLSLEEMKTIQGYFRSIGRNPTDCELEALAQTWSEHCKHKTMMGALLYNGKRIKNLLKDTIMKVTAELNKPWCVSVFKDNSGIIKFDSKHNICFKVETHNHPSALEPYGGAETGIGGVIRDPLGTGRGAKPIINTDVFCFGIPDMALRDVPKGALHPKRVLKGVVSGVRDYGNKMGIPTVNGAVYFDERYTGNPLVFCGNVGIMPKEFSTKKASPGDLIVAVGGKTGRDGIHGATFSSSELTTESEAISGTAVQIGNPITEKKMVDTLLKARDLNLYDAITDCGAGGFSSAVGEMGEKLGAEVHLEDVPLKYEGLRPWEIWISEAQERMVLAVNKKNIKRIMEIFKEENVEATVIGKFTKSKRLEVYYKKHKVIDLDMDFLHEGLPRITRMAEWKMRKERKEILPKKKKDYTKDLLKILLSWNVCSKEWIIRQYDHEVQGGSVLKPLVGINNDGPSDASVTRPLLNSTRGIILSNGINPRYGEIDPYWMAASAIDEALRQIIAVGGDIERTALLDNFCWGSTRKKEQLGSLVRASQACYDMAKIYGTPFISGKDSLNNEFNTGKKTISIPPTLLISAISVISDVRKSISLDIKRSGSLIYVIGKTFQELGGSQYLLVNKKKGGMIPRVRPKYALLLMKRISSLAKEGLILSMHDLSEGGITVALSEMLFSGGFGAKVSLKQVPRDKAIKRDDVILFSESNSRFIVEVDSKNKKIFEQKMRGIPIGLIGETQEEKRLAIYGTSGEEIISAHIDKLKESWKRPFKDLMHENC